MRCILDKELYYELAILISLRVLEYQGSMRLDSVTMTTKSCFGPKDQKMLEKLTLSYSNYVKVVSWRHEKLSFTMVNRTL